jgi:hypothetical protein
MQYMTLHPIPLILLTYEENFILFFISAEKHLHETPCRIEEGFSEQ